MEKNILWFKEISKSDIASVGGKGANLGEMYNIGLPIPPGFCITAQAYKRFIENAGIDKEIYSVLENLNVENTEQLYDASEKVQEIILDTEMPKELASDIKNAYNNMNIDIDVIKTTSREAVNMIKAGRELSFVAVRSSATAEDLPSIDKDSYVLIKINGKPIYDTIENIYNKIGDGTTCLIEVASMKNNEVKWVRAKQIYKHPAKNKKLYKITTETGREITLTENHSLITLNKDKLEPKTNCIKDLKENEFVPVTKRIELLNLNEKEINVLDYVTGKDVVCQNNLIYIKNKSFNWRIQNPLPKKLRIDRDFAYFLGLYCAEGSTYKNNCIMITNSDNRVIKRAKKFLKNILLYNNQIINKNSIRVYCKSFVRLLHKLTGEPLQIKGKGRSCKIKQVPNFIFGCNKDIISSFIAGCFDGDGYVHKEGIEYYSTSKRLIGGVVKLLEMLDIEFYIRQKKWVLSITLPGSQSKKFENLIKLENKSKFDRLKKLVKIYNRINHFQVLNPVLLPKNLSQNIKFDFDQKLRKNIVEIGICPYCTDEIEKTSYYKNKQRFYCKNCRKAFYEENVEKAPIEKYVNYDEKGRFLQNSIPWNKGLIRKSKLSKNRFKNIMKDYDLDKYSKFFDSSSILWDRIKKIEEIKYNGDVYDFTVPGIENFAAGIGGIITHNTASFAGQQATYLNVRGAEDLLKTVKKCWASLFTARAIYYRVKNNFEHSKVFISVVIQKMVNSESAGVMFTMNPATNNRNEIVIEAGFGLGEAVVGGSITPDRYIIDKQTLAVKRKEIHEQPWAILRNIEKGNNYKRELSSNEGKTQKVSDKNLKVLSELGVKIEEHYKVPQDTEFAIENNKVFIVQARPVTTIEKTGNIMQKQEELKEKEILIKGLNAGPGIGSGKVKIVHGLDDLSKIGVGDILVARMTDPDMVPAMKRAAAIVTDAGGTTCHAAIVGREMGLPVVVGTMKATQILKDNDEVTVDGYTGNIYRGIIDIDHKKMKEEEPLIGGERIETVTEIKVIMDLPEYAEKAAKKNPDGVGLLRCEFMILGRKVHPIYLIENNRKEELVNNLAEDIKIIASAFKDKPVWYRTLDAPTDEFRHLEGGENEPEEDNPMMGWRSIRRDLDQPEMLKAQFEAIKKVHDAGFTNVGVMIPLVTSVEQIRRSKEYLKEIGLEPLEEIEFGVMIETPASVQIIKEICEEGIDFISLGTNDLTQFTLAVDRNNAKIQGLYNEMHPAVLRQIEQVIKTCREHNVESSICGQAGSKPEMIEWLVRHGIDSISVNPDMVYEAKKLVYKTERKMLLKFARNGD